MLAPAPSACQGLECPCRRSAHPWVHALIEACPEPGQPKRLEPLQVYNRRQILRHTLLCISVTLAKDSLVSIVGTTKPT